MSVRSILFTIAILGLTVSACKKEAPKSAGIPVNPISNQTATISQVIAGKWLVKKDSIKAFDYSLPIPFNQKLAFNNADYVVFNKDSTGIISSQVTYNALYTDYTKLYINPDESSIPNFNFKYQTSAKDSTLNIPLINSFIGIVYRILKVDDKNLVFYTQTYLEKYPHNYLFKQYIYLSR